VSSTRRPFLRDSAGYGLAGSSRGARARPVLILLPPTPINRPHQGGPTRKRASTRGGCWPFCRTSCERSPLEPAAATMEPLVRTKTPASDAPCSGLTQPRYRAWKPSTPTSPTGSKRPRTKDGSARSPQSRPPWPPPHRNWRPCAAPPPALPPQCALGCQTSAVRPDDPVQTPEAAHVSTGSKEGKLNAPRSR